VLLFWQNFWRISDVLGKHSAWQEWKLTKTIRIKTNKLGCVCRAWRTSDAFAVLLSADVRFMDYFKRKNNTRVFLYVSCPVLQNPQCFSVTQLSNWFTTDHNNCAVNFEICGVYRSIVKLCPQFK